MEKDNAAAMKLSSICLFRKHVTKCETRVASSLKQNNFSQNKTTGGRTVDWHHEQERRVLHSSTVWEADAPGSFLEVHHRSCYQNFHLSIDYYIDHTIL